MKIVIYRNIKGIFEPRAFELWKSFANLLGCTLNEYMTKNTRTIKVYRKRENATFKIFHSEPESHLYFDDLRLEPADPQLINLIDRLIYQMSLSGEKHVIGESIRASTVFNKGKVVKPDDNNYLAQFELLLIRETIFGHIHLSLDRMVECKRSGNHEKLGEIKETISTYQKLLTKLIKQIDSK